MQEVTVNLAGQKIRIAYIYASTKKFFDKYITEELILNSHQTTILIEIRPDDIKFERNKSALEDKREGILQRFFPDEYLETLAIYRKIAELLIEKDILLFHGSVISVDQEGYLFTGKSGTGKSTHTRLWREFFGKRAVMVNDDKPLLQITDSGVIAYGPPWDGKHRLSNNIAVPLKGLCMLKRSPDNQIQRIDKREAYPILLQQVFRSNNPERLMKILSLLDKLAAHVPLYVAHCNMEKEAVMIVYEEMHRRYYGKRDE